MVVKSYYRLPTLFFIRRVALCFFFFGKYFQSVEVEKNKKNKLLEML
jgi:hypothetical protein